jgi:thiamine biosynthesis lipoprotein
VPDLRFDAIGTSWSIETPESLSPSVVALVRDRIERFDATYSRVRDDSLVSTVARDGGTHRFPDDAAAMFDVYDTLFRSTSGAMTPLVGRSLERLGYDAQYSLTRQGVTVPPPWNSVSRAGSTLTTGPQLIDVGAAGKGHIVDLVGAVLLDARVDEFVIDASGDLLICTREARRVALEHPFDPSMAIGFVELDHGSICASGSNRRVWGEGLHHILDGRTGEPTSNVIATWAIADSALVADGLATALFFASPADLAADFEFDWVRVFASGDTERSRTLPGELFS